VTSQRLLDMRSARQGRRRLAWGLFTPSKWERVTLLMLAALRTTAAFVLNTTLARARDNVAFGPSPAVSHKITTGLVA